MTTPSLPTLGQLVHYLDDSSEPSCLAAWVTQVDPGDFRHVGLCVLYPSGTFFKNLTLGGVWHADDGTPDSWHTVDGHTGLE